MNLHDEIRQHALAACGALATAPERPLPSYDALRKSSWDPELDVLLADVDAEFVARMRARLTMGAIRYNRLGKNLGGGIYAVDVFPHMLRKRAEYARTGNHECLVDLANYEVLWWAHSPRAEWCGHALVGAVHTLADIFDPAQCTPIDRKGLFDVR